MQFTRGPRNRDVRADGVAGMVSATEHSSVPQGLGCLTADIYLGLADFLQMPIRQLRGKP